MEVAANAQHDFAQQLRANHRLHAFTTLILVAGFVAIGSIVWWYGARVESASQSEHIRQHTITMLEKAKARSAEVRAKVSDPASVDGLDRIDRLLNETIRINRGQP